MTIYYNYTVKDVKYDVSVVIIIILKIAEVPSA